MKLPRIASVVATAAIAPAVLLASPAFAADSPSAGAPAASTVPDLPAGRAEFLGTGQFTARDKDKAAGQTSTGATSAGNTHLSAAGGSAALASTGGGSATALIAGGSAAALGAGAGLIYANRRRRAASKS
ncbi:MULTISPECIES: LAETG motif-containing sortase-dependent surface protein [unclassified Streptomyces]|uniref:LAETG motif-containing sortase-dependent surface protein n=1 Tax=unclassified Streptomyces TaxID=2593676 RepID=UPI002E0D1AE3|nr:hypothetical protein OG573_08630 [Streptomyces sp. NBC_01205]